MLQIIAILAVAVTLPIAWFLSEFQQRRWIRLILGCGAVAMSFFVAYAVGELQHLNANIWYGQASQQLVDNTIEQLERGNQRQVIEALKSLQSRFEPTYENRGRYDELVEQYVDQLKSGTAEN